VENAEKSGVQAILPWFLMFIKCLIVKKLKGKRSIWKFLLSAIISNVNNAVNMEQWILMKLKLKELPDIYAIGLQDILILICLRSKKEVRKTQIWEDPIQNSSVLLVKMENVSLKIKMVTRLMILFLKLADSNSDHAYILKNLNLIILLFYFIWIDTKN